MEVLSQVQNVVMEHAFTIGIGLLVLVVLVGITWYWMSRPAAKSEVLENQARVNGTTLDAPPDVPASALSPEPQIGNVVQENTEDQTE